MPKLIKFIIILSTLIIVLLGIYYLVILRKETPFESRSQVIFQEEESKFVEGFPEISIPPDTEIIDSYKKEEDSLVGYEANLITKLSPYDAMSWLKKYLEDQDWEIYDESVEEGAGELYISASKDGQNINILEDTNEGQTIITVEFPVR
jgi:hypothetical protein